MYIVSILFFVSLVKESKKRLRTGTGTVQFKPEPDQSAGSGYKTLNMTTHY